MHGIQQQQQSSTGVLYAVQTQPCTVVPTQNVLPGPQTKRRRQFLIVSIILICSGTLCILCSIIGFQNGGVRLVPGLFSGLIFVATGVCGVLAAIKNPALIKAFMVCSALSVGMTFVLCIFSIISAWTMIGVMATLIVIALVTAGAAIYGVVIAYKAYHLTTISRGPVIMNQPTVLIRPPEQHSFFPPPHQQHYVHVAPVDMRPINSNADAPPPYLEALNYPAVQTDQREQQPLNSFDYGSPVCNPASAVVPSAPPLASANDSTT